MVNIEEIKVTPKANIYNTGLLLKLHRAAFVFGHGSWRADDSLVVRHYTTLRDKDLPTDSLINALHNQGINYIWMSACAAGDYEFMSFDRITRKKILWPEFVSRGDSGDIIPVFFFWLGRINIGKRINVDTSDVKLNSVGVRLRPVISFHEKDSVKTLTKQDKQFIFNQVKEARKKEGLSKIVYSEEKYKIPVVKISEIVAKNTPLTQTDLAIKLNKKILRLKAVGWIRNKSFPIYIEIEPLVEY